MRYLSSVIFGVVVLLALFWLPAIVLIQRTVTPWRQRRKHEIETGESRRFRLQAFGFTVIDEPYGEPPADPKP